MRRSEANLNPIFGDTLSTDIYFRIIRPIDKSVAFFEKLIKPKEGAITRLSEVRFKPVAMF